MNRLLMALTVFQFLVIIALSYLLLSQDTEPEVLPPNPAPEHTEGDAKETARRHADSRVENQVLPGVGTSPSKAPPEAAKSEDALSVSLLYGEVTAPSGVSLDQIRINVFDTQKSRNDRSGIRLASVSSNGSCSIAGLEPSVWRLVCKVEGCLEYKTEIDLTVSTLRREDILLQEAVVLLVKINTPSGKPINKLLQTEARPWPLSLTVVATKDPIKGDLPMTPRRDHSRLGDGEWCSASSSSTSESRFPRATRVRSSSRPPCQQI